MLLRVLFLTVFCIQMGVLSSSQAGEDIWFSDFEAAKVRAKKEGKDILLDFTGSDWCKVCTVLKDEVFSKVDFMIEAPDQFVLLELDFPKTWTQSLELAKQNEDLRTRFGVQGFPTLILLDADGELYAQTSYRPGGVTAYLKHLFGLKAHKKARNEVLAKLKDASGKEKALLLDTYIKVMKSAGVSSAFQEEIEQIKELDKDGSAGLKPKYEAMETLSHIEAQFQATFDIPKVLSDLEALLKTSAKFPDITQNAYYFMAEIYLQAAKDEANGLSSLKKAYAANPTSSLGQRALSFINEIERAAAASQVGKIPAPEGLGELPKDIGAPEDKTDPFGKETNLQVLQQIERDLRISQDYDRALKYLDKFIAVRKLQAELFQRTYLLKGVIYIQGKRDKAAGLICFRTALKAAPDSELGKKLTNVIKDLEKDSVKGPAGPSQQAAQKQATSEEGSKK